MQSSLQARTWSPLSSRLRTIQSSQMRLPTRAATCASHRRTPGTAVSAPLQSVRNTPAHAYAWPRVNDDQPRVLYTDTCGACLGVLFTSCTISQHKTCCAHLEAATLTSRSGIGIQQHARYDSTNETCENKKGGSFFLAGCRVKYHWHFAEMRVNPWCKRCRKKPTVPKVGL
jgi:hypothetical protein